MTSIEGLLEDEQGLSMGEMLTVKFRQPSHEFTFGLFIALRPGATHQRRLDPFSLARNFNEGLIQSV
jgi:hypothetical protein